MEYQDQPLVPDFFLLSSVPPAPSVLPLHPLAEPPAPALSPLQALFPVAQLLRVKVDPAIRPAIQKPARIFFRSSTSMVASCMVEGIRPFPGAGNRQTQHVLISWLQNRKIDRVERAYPLNLSDGFSKVNPGSRAAAIPECPPAPRVLRPPYCRNPLGFAAAACSHFSSAAANSAPFSG